MKYKLSFGQSVYWRYSFSKEYSRNIIVLSKKKALNKLKRLHNCKWIDWTELEKV